MDREKVINDLQDAVNDDWMWQHADYYAKAMENAIALLKENETMMQCIKMKCCFCPHCANCDVDENGLLKEQEAQFVLNVGEQISCKSGSCPKCGKMLNTTCNKNFCGECGQAVKWE